MAGARGHNALLAARFDAGHFKEHKERALKIRLFHRRLTVSSPRMKIRSATPWPVRWVVAALMFGFSAAIALWAFEIGKDLAGIEGVDAKQVNELQQQVATLRAELDKAQSIANTADSVLVAEKAVQEKLAEQLREMEAANRLLRDDLGFFEKLMPGGASESAAVRGLQAEMISELQLRWQALVIQPVKNAPTFSGKLELTFTGTLAGKPWITKLPGGDQALSFKQYRRLEGVLDLPPQAVVKTVTAKVLEGTTVRSVQTIKL
jgi:hypothetical protein